MINQFRSKFKFIMLPLGEIDAHMPKKGLIIDLGCGEGVISTHLASVRTRQVLGIDADTKRVPKKSKKNITFKKGDITNLKYPKSDGVLLSDVLHHLSIDKQKKVLTNIYKSLNKNGVLIIKEIDTGELIRSKFSRLWDFLLYPKDKINFRNAEDLSSYLKKTGFKVSVKRPCRFFPGSTTLFVCKK